MKENTELKRMLLIIDPQNGFITGSLPVPNAESAMEHLCGFINANKSLYECCGISMDSHPANHCSFKENGGIWVRHCVHGTLDEMIYSRLLDTVSVAFPSKGSLFVKGTDAEREEYSMFDSEDNVKKFREVTRDFHINEVHICGIVREICVLDSIKGLHEKFPDIAVKCLIRYTPSLDNGEKFEEYLSQNTSWLRVIETTDEDEQVSINGVFKSNGEKIEINY